MWRARFIVDPRGRRGVRDARALLISVATGLLLLRQPIADERGECRASRRLNPKHASGRAVCDRRGTASDEIHSGRSGRGAWRRRVGKSGAAGTLEVVLRGAGWSVDLDEVLRIPSGIVVLETRAAPEWVSASSRRRPGTGARPGGRGRQARQGDAAASAARPGHRRVFRRCASFWGAAMRSPPAVRRLRRRSRAQPFPSAPRLACYQCPCRLGTVFAPRAVCPARICAPAT
jgi:hypothetical protein